MKALAVPALLLALTACGRGEAELRTRVERHVKAAAALEDAGRVDDAIGEYGKALALVEGRDRWKTRVAELRAILKELEDRQEEIARATLEFKRFMERVDRDDGSGSEALLREGRELRRRVRDSGLPWLPKLGSALERLSKLLDEHKE